MNRNCCLIGIFLLFSATGCGNPESVGQLETKISKLEKANKGLEARLQQLEVSAKLVEATHRGIEKSVDNRIDGCDERVASLEGRWRSFKEAYTPEVRDQLKNNHEAADKTLKLLTEVEERSQSIVTAIEKAASEASSLKDRVKEHEQQARDSNWAGRLEDQIAKFKTDFARVKTDTAQHTQALRELKTRIGPVPGRNLSSRLLRLEGKVQSLESRIR